MIDFEEFASFCRQIDPYLNLTKEYDPSHCTRIDPGLQRRPQQSFRLSAMGDENNGKLKSTTMNTKAKREIRGMNLVQKLF